MRNILLASLVGLSALVANTGCLIGGCGGWEGASNRVYERNNEMLILCGNGGYVAALETTMLEGRYASDSVDYTKTIATRGEDGRVEFELVDHGDGTASAVQLGDAAWTAKAFDQVELDHSNVLCEDLEYRTWWVQQ